MNNNIIEKQFPTGSPAFVDIVLWDWKEQPNFERIDYLLQAVTNKHYNYSEDDRICRPAVQLVPNTHRDEYVAVISSRSLTPEETQLVFDEWVYED